MSSPHEEIPVSNQNPDPREPGDPRRPLIKDPSIPPTAQMAVIATLAITAILSVGALVYSACVKGVESALTQISNLTVLIVGILAGLVAGKNHDTK